MYVSPFLSLCVCVLELASTGVVDRVVQYTVLEKYSIGVLEQYSTGVLGSVVLQPVGTGVGRQEMGV